MLPEAVPEPRHPTSHRRPAREAEDFARSEPPPARFDPFGRWLKLAAAVVERSSREQPADAVLRQCLREVGGLSGSETTQITKAVFSYFRWLGWIKPDLRLESKIRAGLEHADEFERRPHAFRDDELFARVVPEWVHEATAATAAWARAIQGEPPLWLRAKPGRAQALAQVLGYTHPGALPDALNYTGASDLFRQPEFHAGEFEIQDIASQAVGWACTPQPGETWWDACAGEGGKLLHLSVLMRGKGLIWASDRAAWRLKKLRLRAARAHCSNYRPVPWDGGARPPTKTRFAGVLLDAPCTGLGTWQRNPHARWTTTPDDVRELAAVQTRLLNHIAPSVKPGGKLIYSVCTLTRAETEEVAAAFQAAHPEFSPLPLAHPLEAGAAPQPQLLLWPQHTGGGGMFIAGWRRSS